MTKDREEQEDIENQGFKVKDRRRFAPDGTLREGSEKGKEEKTQANPSETPSEPAPPHEPPEEGPAPSADLSSLLLSLAASAQAALGISPDPITGKLNKNLPQAKSVIDLMGVLEEKTKGNLTPEEEHLFQVILHDLRIRFVEAQKEGKPDEK